MCSTSWPISAAIDEWCASSTASRVCQRGRSPGRLSSVSGFYSYLVAREIPVSSRTLCLAGYQREGVVAGDSSAVGACAVHFAEDPCPEEVRASAAAANWPATERWFWPWWSAVSVAAKFSAPRLSDVDVANRAVRGGRQRRASASDPDSEHVLHGRRLLARRATVVWDRPGVRHVERPASGEPMTADGVDKVLQAARVRAGLAKAHPPISFATPSDPAARAGLLEAVQAQAGHVSIESTRIDPHLTDEWLAAGSQGRAARSMTTTPPNRPGGPA